MSFSRYASIDVGSNTVRLLIAEPLPEDDFRPLRVERVITRLGGNFSAAGNLCPASMIRTLGALRRFADLLQEEGVERAFAVATGVVREAKNGAKFLETVFRETGLSLRLLSGEEEARMMLQGVLWSLRERTSSRLIADVGGWSTEVLWVEGTVPRVTLSLMLGAVALTERFLKSDPPRHQELEGLEAHTRNFLGGVKNQMEKEGRETKDLHPHLVGTAGTATTLAAVDLGLWDYDPRKINGHRISHGHLENIYLHLRSLSIDERRKVPGLERGREDVVVAGTAILLSLLDVFRLTTLEVIDSGLLEGALLEGMKHEAGSKERGAESREHGPTD